MLEYLHVCFTYRLHNECSATYLLYDIYHINAIFIFPTKKTVRSEVTILHYRRRCYARVYQQTKLPSTK